MLVRMEFRGQYSHPVRLQDLGAKVSRARHIWIRYVAIRDTVAMDTTVDCSSSDGGDGGL